MERKFVNQARRYIEKNYMNIRHLHDIASGIHCNYHSLRYYFTIYTGVTLGEYLAEIRCKKALELLKNRQWKLYRVAREIGLHDDKQFIRIFEKYCNIPPDTLRQHLMR